MRGAVSPDGPRGTAKNQPVSLRLSPPLDARHRQAPFSKRPPHQRSAHKTSACAPGIDGCQWSTATVACSPPTVIIGPTP